jgi:hypothetical protein
MATKEEELDAVLQELRNTRQDLVQTQREVAANSQKTADSVRANRTERMANTEVIINGLIDSWGEVQNDPVRSRELRNRLVRFITTQRNNMRRERDDLQAEIAEFQQQGELDEPKKAKLADLQNTLTNIQTRFDSIQSMLDVFQNQSGITNEGGVVPPTAETESAPPQQGNQENDAPPPPPPKAETENKQEPKQAVTETDILAREEELFQQLQDEWTGGFADFDEKAARANARRRAEYELGVAKEEKTASAEEIAQNRTMFVMDYVEREFAKLHPNRGDAPYTDEEIVERSKLREQALAEWDKTQGAENTSARGAGNGDNRPPAPLDEKEAFILDFIARKLNNEHDVGSLTPEQQETLRAVYRNHAEAEWAKQQDAKKEQETKETEKKADENQQSGGTAGGAGTSGGVDAKQSASHDKTVTQDELNAAARRYKMDFVNGKVEAELKKIFPNPVPKEEMESARKILAEKYSHEWDAKHPGLQENLNPPLQPLTPEAEEAIKEQIKQQLQAVPGFNNLSNNERKQMFDRLYDSARQEAIAKGAQVPHPNGEPNHLGAWLGVAKFAAGKFVQAFPIALITGAGVALLPGAVLAAGPIAVAAAATAIGVLASTGTELIRVNLQISKDFKAYQKQHPGQKVTKEDFYSDRDEKRYKDFCAQHNAEHPDQEPPSKDQFLKENGAGRKAYTKGFVGKAVKGGLTGAVMALTGGVGGVIANSVGGAITKATGSVLATTIAPWIAKIGVSLLFGGSGSVKTAKANIAQNNITNKAERAALTFFTLLGGTAATMTAGHLANTAAAGLLNSIPEAKTYMETRNAELEARAGAESQEDVRTQSGEDHRVMTEEEAVEQGWNKEGGFWDRDNDGIPDTIDRDGGDGSANAPRPMIDRDNDRIPDTIDRDGGDGWANEQPASETEAGNNPQAPVQEEPSHNVIGEHTDKNGMPYRVVEGKAGDGYFDKNGWHMGDDGVIEKASTGEIGYNADNYAAQLKAAGLGPQQGTGASAGATRGLTGETDGTSLELEQRELTPDARYDDIPRALPEVAEAAKEDAAEIKGFELLGKNEANDGVHARESGHGVTEVWVDKDGDLQVDEGETSLTSRTVEEVGDDIKAFGGEEAGIGEKAGFKAYQEGLAEAAEKYEAISQIEGETFTEGQIKANVAATGDAGVVPGDKIVTINKDGTTSVETVTEIHDDLTGSYSTTETSHSINGRPVSAAEWDAHQKALDARMEVSRQLNEEYEAGLQHDGKAFSRAVVNQDGHSLTDKTAFNVMRGTLARRLPGAELVGVDTDTGIVRVRLPDGKTIDTGVDFHGGSDNTHNFGDKDATFSPALERYIEQHQHQQQGGGGIEREP